MYDFQGYVLVAGGLHQRPVHRAKRPFAEHPIEHDSPSVDAAHCAHRNGNNNDSGENQNEFTTNRKKNQIIVEQ